MISQGQITGIIAGGFALIILGLVIQRWHIAGIGIAIALIKFQLGTIPLCALLLLWDTGWINKLKTLFIPSAFFVLSLFLYPAWPYQLVRTIVSNPLIPKEAFRSGNGLVRLLFYSGLPPYLLNYPNKNGFVCC